MVTPERIRIIHPSSCQDTVPPFAIARKIQRGQWNDLVKRLTSAKDLERTHSEYYSTYGRSILHDICKVSSVELRGFVVKKVIETCPAALMWMDKFENIPLHLACALGNLETVKTILEHYSFGISAFVQAQKRNKRTFTPLDVLWKKFLEPWYEVADEDSLRSFTLTYEEEEINRVEDNIEKLKNLKRAADLVGDLRVIWDKTTLFLQLFSNFSGKIEYTLLGGRQWSTIHSISGRGGITISRSHRRCPSAILYVALKMYPEQVRQKDETGNLPLHNILSHPSAKWIKVDIGWALSRRAKEFLTACNQTMLEMILDKYPMGCKVANRNGRLPLFLAIESGRNWDEGLSIIWKYYPEAAAIRDKATKMYPVMLAAVSDKLTLDTVYELIRCHPDIVADGIKKTTHEAYLEKQNRELKEKLKSCEKVLGSLNLSGIGDNRNDNCTQEEIEKVASNLLHIYS